MFFILATQWIALQTSRLLRFLKDNEGRQGSNTHLSPVWWPWPSRHLYLIFRSLSPALSRR